MLRHLGRRMTHRFIGMTTNRWRALSAKTLLNRLRLRHRGLYASNRAPLGILLACEQGVEMAEGRSRSYPERSGDFHHVNPARLDCAMIYKCVELPRDALVLADIGICASRKYLSTHVTKVRTRRVPPLLRVVEAISIPLVRISVRMRILIRTARYNKLRVRDRLCSHASFN